MAFFSRICQLEVHDFCGGQSNGYACECLCHWTPENNPQSIKFVSDEKALEALLYEIWCYKSGTLEPMMTAVFKAKWPDITPETLARFKNMAFRMLGFPDWSLSRVHAIIQAG